MSSDDEPEIVYEPAPGVVPLTGNETGATAEEIAQVCWLLKRYSSYSYIERAHTLFARVVRAYTQWPNKVERLSREFAEQTAITLHEHESAFVRGLEHLRNARLREGYAEIVEAVSELEPRDPRDERHLSISLLLDELGPRVAGDGTRAAAMARRIEHTLKATWAYERILANRLSLQMAPRRFPNGLPAVAVPASSAPQVTSGARITHTGIWLPIAIKRGCPNFLIAGENAPDMTGATTRYDYAELRGPGGTDGREAWSDFDFEEQPTKWRLLWHDARYERGLSDDDPEFLDEDNALD